MVSNKCVQFEYDHFQLLLRFLGNHTFCYANYLSIWGMYHWLCGCLLDDVTCSFQCSYSRIFNSETWIAWDKTEVWPAQFLDSNSSGLEEIIKWVWFRRSFLIGNTDPVINKFCCNYRMIRRTICRGYLVTFHKTGKRYNITISTHKTKCMITATQMWTRMKI